VDVVGERKRTRENALLRGESVGELVQVGENDTNEGSGE
jgi:hypothetical protein